MGTLAAEFTKVSTTRLWWILLLVLAVVAAGYAALPGLVAVLGAEGAAPLTDAGTVASIVHGGNPVSRIIALVLGVVIMGSEVRHRTLTTTWLAQPRRGRVVAAKTVVSLVVGCAYGAASVLAGSLVAWAFIAVYGGTLGLTQPLTWRSLGLGVVSIGLWALLGFGLAVLTRSLVLAMIIGIAFAYLIEPSLAVLFSIQGWDLALNLMPTGATNAMLGLTSPILFPSADPFSWWQGLLVLAGWALVPTVLGVATTVRRDVT